MAKDRLCFLAADGMQAWLADCATAVVVSLLSRLAVCTGGMRDVPLNPDTEGLAAVEEEVEEDLTTPFVDKLLRYLLFNARLAVKEDEKEEAAAVVVALTRDKERGRR